MNCKTLFVYEGPWIFVACVVPIFYPGISFPLHFVCGVYFHFGGFTAFLERSSHLAGPIRDSGTCSLLVEKFPVLASFLQAQHPCSPKLSAFVILACGVGIETHWDRLIWTSGGERKLPAFSSWGSFSFILVFYLFLSFVCALLSLSLSLCRFLLFASCLPHPKSWSKPYTSWTYKLHNHLRGRYYYNLHFTDEETEVEGFPRSCPRSYRYKGTLPGSLAVWPRFEPESVQLPIYPLCSPYLLVVGKIRKPKLCVGEDVHIWLWTPSLSVEWGTWTSAVAFKQHFHTRKSSSENNEKVQIFQF